MTRYAVALALTLLALAACNTDRLEPDWTFDRPASCGNGRVDPNEVCDADRLAGATCGDFGYAGGDLRCNTTCAGYLVSGCEGIADWAASAQMSDDELGPCASCADDEVCIGGACESRTCGSGEAPEVIDETWDIPEVTIGGTVSVTEGERPTKVKLYLEEQQHETVVEETVTLDESGGFETSIYPGTYRVWVQPLGEAWPAYPLERGMFETGEGSTLDLTVPRPVTLSGELAPGPNADGLDMTFAFRHDDSEIPSPDKVVVHHVSGKRWPQSYKVSTYPGESLDVVYRPDFEAFPYRNLKQVSGRIVRDLSIERDTRRDITVPVEAVALNVNVDGRKPTEEHDVFIKVFKMGLQEPNPVVSLERRGDEPEGALSDGEFEARLPRGDYRIEARLFPEGAQLQEPIVQTAEVSVPGARDVDFDLPFDENRVRLTGRIERAEGWPDGSFPLLGIVVRKPDGDAVLIEHFGQDVSNQFEFQLPEGTYDIFATSSLDSGSGDRLEGRTKIRSKMRISHDEEPYRLEVTAPVPVPEQTATLKGRVTVNGERVDRVVGLEEPREMVGSPAGRIEFEPLDRRGSSASADLGDGVFQVDVEPGRYRVVYQPPRSHLDGQNSTVADTIAGSRYVLDPDLTVEEGGRRDFDLKAVKLEGRVTVDGHGPKRREPVLDQDGPGPLGSIGLGELNDSWRYGESLEPGEEAATFETLAFPGHYRLGVEVARTGGRDVRIVTLADDPVERTFRWASTQIEGRLRYRGEPVSLPEGVGSNVGVETRSGRISLPIGENGGFSGRVAGRDPVLTFGHHGGTAAEVDKVEMPDGVYVLREGCAP